MFILFRGEMLVQYRPDEVLLMFFNIFILLPRIISPVRGSFSRLMYINHIRHALTRITSALE